MLMEDADQIAIGKEFQSLGPIIEKALKGLVGNYNFKKVYEFYFIKFC